MQRMLKSIVSILISILPVINLIAAETVFTATVSKNRVVVGERFTVTFTLNAEGRNFQPPPFNYFRVLSGPSRSSSHNMNYINGRMTKSTSVSYSYNLIPKKVGKYSIGSASITANGKTISSNSINIDVIKSSARNQSRTSGSNTKQPTNIKASDKLFLEVSVNKTKVYQGEQVIATIKIYSQLDLSGFNSIDFPDYNSFWTQDVKMPARINLTRITINGKVYNTGTLKKTILFPQRTGTLKIDPMELVCIVRQRTTRHSHSIFDQFWGGGYKNVEYKLKSKPIKITVLPLPSSNKPEFFNGAVGKFTMKTGLDKNQLKANEAATLTVRISGKGNMKLIDSPDIPFPPDFESYDPRITDNISTKSTGVSGSRTFEYLLIPRHAGEYKIEPIKFCYFDPSKKSYITLTSTKHELIVEKGEEGAITTLSSINKENVKFIGSDIMFIKNLPFQLRKKGEFFFLSVNFFALYTSPILFLLLFLLLRKQKIEDKKNVVMMKSKRATKTAKKRLSKAKSYLKEGKDEQFYDETLKALWGYLGDKLSIPVAELSKDAVRESLNRRSVSNDTINQFISILDHCEFARYAAHPPAPSLREGESPRAGTPSPLVSPQARGEGLESQHSGTPARMAGKKVLPAHAGEDLGGAGIEKVYANGLQVISDIEHEIR